ncbi:MAG: hypothetical protein ACT4RN_14150, partial [Pseudonocardia sp.]
MRARTPIARLEGGVLALGLGLVAIVGIGFVLHLLPVGLTGLAWLVAAALVAAGLVVARRRRRRPVVAGPAVDG